jgi:DNA-binding NarL/FixJ family response regulator
MEIKVVIIEDNNDIRNSLSILINGSGGFTCLQTFENAEDAIIGIPGLNPDVALVDVHLPKGTGIDAIGILKPLCPTTQFMIFTIFEDEETVFNALKAGASGYLLKNTPPDKILNAISDIYQGGSPMSGQIARKVLQSFVKQNNPNVAQLSSLTQRENEILNFLAKGYRYKEIASKIFISTETVRTHIRNIYEKLQVESRTEALNKLYNK